MNKKYLPKSLSRKDMKKQFNMLKRSIRDYKKGKYYTRKQVKSFKSKPSGHVANAVKTYKVNKITANKNLSKKTGCKVSTLRKIVKKGMGAYYSSGSRPNQTAQSWGRARLASAITGGPSSKVDIHELKKGCSKKSKALRLAKKFVNQSGGKKKTRKNMRKKTQKMKETIVKMERGPKFKKYTAYIRNNATRRIRKIHFGDNRYEQFKDRTKLGLYSSKNHDNKNRQYNYYNRHSGEPNRKKAIALEKKKSGGNFNAKILSHIYLW